MINNASSGRCWKLCYCKLINENTRTMWKQQMKSFSRKKKKRNRLRKRKHQLPLYEKLNLVFFLWYLNTGRQKRRSLSAVLFFQIHSSKKKTCGQYLSSIVNRPSAHSNSKRVQTTMSGKSLKSLFSFSRARAKWERRDMLLRIIIILTDYLQKQK